MESKDNPNNPLGELLHAMGTALTQVATRINQMESSLESSQKTQELFIRASYQAHTASGKSRLASQLVDEIAKDNPSTARIEVAKMLGVSKSRVNQLLGSDKNRKNGK